jgi:hypothetical protein
MTNNLYKTIGITNQISKQALGLYTSPSSMFNQSICLGRPVVAPYS